MQKKSIAGRKLLCYSPWLKRLLIMKMIAILILVVGLTTSYAETDAQTAKVNLKFNTGTVKDVIEEIEHQTNLSFMYDNDVFKVDRQISIEAENETLKSVVEKLISGENLKYEMVNRFIVITSAKEPPANQQGKKVSGKVTDSNGGSLPGVSVVIKGTTTGVITDNSGNYSLSNISENAILQFSFVGMKTQEVKVENQTIINLVLVEETIGLEEVIAIGYGTVKKSDLTGSVSLVSSKDMGDRQAISLGSLIQGRVSGVDVAADGEIRVRGVGTINNSRPLYVIDGFVGGDFETVNPNDVEHIEVLKDASATAIYGAQGANGVVLVTTKGGKVGPLKVSVNAYTGIATTPKKIDVLNASQYIDYLQDAFENSGASLPSALMTIYPDARKDVTNWQDAAFRTASTSEISANFSGGSDRATYFTSIGYKYSEFIALGPKDNTFYVRNKNDFNISKWFHIGNNFSFSYITSEGQQPNLQWMTQMPQFLPIYDSANLGGYSAPDRSTGVDGGNPLTSALTHPKRSTLRYQTDLWAEIEPLKGLKYRIQAGVKGDFGHYKTWQDVSSYFGITATKNSITEGYSHSFVPLIENTLTYSNIFGKHDLSVMVGSSWQNYARGGGIGIYGEDFANPEVKNVFVGKTKNILNQDAWQGAALSYFGRLNYQFANKYLLTLNIRRDGSPKFAPVNRWGTFPSVAVAWKMHEEAFMKNLDIFDQLKLRASWGLAGNSLIPDFMYTSQVWTNGVYYPLGGVAVPGATIAENSSPEIKWETTESKTIGVDMAFLNNLLTVTADYFIKNTNDILFRVPRPSSLGYGMAFGGDAIVNAASIENKGFELLIGYRGKVNGVNYSVNANYTNVKNEVTSLGLGQPYLDGVSRTDVGNPIGYFYGYVADGVFMNQSELDAANALAVSKKWPQYQLAPTRVGDVRFKDLNGDGHVTSDDRQMIGNSIPKHMYGLNITLDYKRFDLNVFLQGIAGSDIYYGVHEFLRGGNTNRNQEAYLLDRWISEANPGNGIVPRAVLGDPNQNNRPSTNMVSSGNYLKLRQLSLGYTLPESLTVRVGIEKVRVYANANNLLTISKYHGYDPEVGGDNTHRGIDNLSYPIPRTIVLGVQIGF